MAQFRIIDGDNVRESFSSGGTVLSLGGAVGTSRPFSAWANTGDTFFGTIRKGAEYSTGMFTYVSGSPGFVAQTEVWVSSNANAAVNFSAGGTGEIFHDPPARLFDNLNMREASIAAAATADLGSVHGKAVQLTGTTGITSFGTGKNKEKLVRYTGAGLTITNGATLVCPGATNLVLATNDVFYAVSDNTATPIWQILWVRRANGDLVPVNVSVPGNLAVASTTASTSTTTGALKVAGGAGFVGQVSANNFNASQSMSNASLPGHFDVASQTAVPVANGSNAIIAANVGGLNGVWFVAEGALTGDTAIYLVFSGSISLAFSALGNFVAPTTTPAAGKFCPAYDGVSKYRIYNNQGGSCSFKAAFFRLQ